MMSDSFSVHGAGATVLLRGHLDPRESANADCTQKGAEISSLPLGKH